MRQTENGWYADCDGRAAESERLADALRDAIALGAGATPIVRSSDEYGLQRWIDETAGHIVGDTTR